MNNGTSVAIGSAGLLLFAGGMLVLAPGVQLSDVQPPDGLEPYTAAEARGRQVYIEEGCMYCHSQQPRDPSQAPDMERGWGRPSVPADYAYDYPHLLGTMRTGPDLLNIGARQPSETWHLLHLYQPRAVVPESIMPSFPYLFTVKPEAAEGDTVVAVPDPWGPEEGVVVADDRALDLVRYLQSLDRTYPIDVELRASQERMP